MHFFTPHGCVLCICQVCADNSASVHLPFVTYSGLGGQVLKTALASVSFIAKAIFKKRSEIKHALKITKKLETFII